MTAKEKKETEVEVVEQLQEVVGTIIPNNEIEGFYKRCKEIAKTKEVPLEKILRQEIRKVVLENTNYGWTDGRKWVDAAIQGTVTCAIGGLVLFGIGAISRRREGMPAEGESTEHNPFEATNRPSRRPAKGVEAVS